MAKIAHGKFVFDPPLPPPNMFEHAGVGHIGGKGGGLLSGLSPSLPPGKVVASVFGGKAGKFETPPPSKQISVYALQKIK